MNITRYIKSLVQQDLEEKMVFIGGPRQVGKTTLARQFLQKRGQYLTWDDLEDRSIIKSHQISRDVEVVIFDEIHKYARWRSLVKGLFDKYSKELSVIVTGSARLDHFRRGGDSLVGRYHYYRLHPFSLAEVDSGYQMASVDRLLRFGGFPESYIKQSDDFSRRWRKERLSRVVYQDLRDLDTVKDLSKMELLVDALPIRVGSPLSIKSLQEDLEVSPNTVVRWIEVLEAVYYCYRITPYGPPKIRAVKQANKLFLWDWSEIESPGPRFENLVASQLLKLCHFLEDTKGHRMELRYLKDVDGREIDFIVLQDRKPIFAVECKTGEKSISPHIKYFAERTTIPKFYQVHLGKKDYGSPETGRVLPFTTFCKELNLV